MFLILDFSYTAVIFLKLLKVSNSQEMCRCGKLGVRDYGEL